jgi:hypothetical protein
MAGAHGRASGRRAPDISGIIAAKKSCRDAALAVLRGCTRGIWAANDTRMKGSIYIFRWGALRRRYYRAIDDMLERYKMNGRTMNPPESEVNAMISYGNALLAVLVYHARGVTLAKRQRQMTSMSVLLTAEAFLQALLGVKIGIF